ncbi:MAG TPA: EAL domain-containing protein [Rhodospirillales bacterium]|nr:EAL domain-containing protein [Rhodospirillales bacterium]
MAFGAQPISVATAGSDDAKLLQHLRAIDPFRTTEAAVRLHLSGVEVLDRKPMVKRLAFHIFTAHTRGLPVCPFMLDSGDIVVVGGTDVQNAIRPALLRLEAFLADNPLADSAATGILASFYDLSSDDDIGALVRSIADGAPVSASPLPSAGAARRPLSAPDVAELCRKLEARGLQDLMRRQTVVQLGTAQARPLFDDVFVSIGELQRLLAPDLDLAAHGPLFRYLTGTLDRMVLEALTADAVPSGGGSGRRISLNLNIASLRSRQFAAFLQAYAHRPPMVEIQLVDALAAGATYPQAHDRLEGVGVGIAIDGVGLRDLEHLDFTSLRCAFVKLLWNQATDARLSAERGAVLHRAIDAIGRDRVILARVESDEALAWGIGAGIRQMEGRYIDRLIVSLLGRSAVAP